MWQRITLNDRRTRYLTFTNNSKTKTGYNRISNRACFVSKMLEKEWMNIDYDDFKCLCKSLFLTV